MNPEKLTHIRSPWRRLLVSLFLSALVFLGQFHRPRAYVHWIGNHGRPRRLERWFFIIVLIVAMFVFKPHDYMVWGLLWGGAASFFIILYTLLTLILRKRYNTFKL